MDSIINVSGTDPDGWYYGELNGVHGLVPSNYVRGLDGGAVCVCVCVWHRVFELRRLFGEDSLTSHAPPSRKQSIQVDVYDVDA